MNRTNPEMTSKLKAILEDPRYHDPKQFTTTLYDASGNLLDVAFVNQPWMSSRPSWKGRPEDDMNVVRKPLKSVFEEERKLVDEGTVPFNASPVRWAPSKLQSIMQDDDIKRDGKVINLPTPEEEGE